MKQAKKTESNTQSLDTIVDSVEITHQCNEGMNRKPSHDELVEMCFRNVSTELIKINVG